MKYLTNIERSTVIADQTEAYLQAGGSIHVFRQGDSGISRNMPFIITKADKEKPGENWRHGEKGIRSY